MPPRSPRIAATVMGGIVSTAILMSAKDDPHSSESAQTSAIERPADPIRHPIGFFTPLAGSRR
jgi:hypothetical protein